MNTLYIAIKGPDGTTDENTITYFLAKDGKALTRSIDGAKVFAELGSGYFGDQSTHEAEAKTAAAKIGGGLFWAGAGDTGAALPKVAGPRVRTSGSQHVAGDTAVFVDPEGTFRAKGYALDEKVGEELPSTVALVNG